MLIKGYGYIHRNSGYIHRIYTNHSLSFQCCHKPEAWIYGSGGLKPTSVRASLAVVLFTQNKKLPPHYAVKRKPVSSTVARALQITGLLLYFGGQQNITFWILESPNGVGVSLLKQEGFARQESFC